MHSRPNLSSQRMGSTIAPSRTHPQPPPKSPIQSKVFSILCSIRSIRFHSHPTSPTWYENTHPPSNCGSWSPRGTDAWYIGPALKHYRCVTCFTPEIQSTRIADTVEYFHPTVPIPQLRTENLIRDAVGDLVTALTLNKKSLPPLTEQYSTHQALTEFTTI